MRIQAKHFLAFLAALMLALSLAGCDLAASSGNASGGGIASSSSASSPSAPASPSPSAYAPAPIGDGSYAETHLVSEQYVPPDISVSENGEYTDKDSVALYIHLFGHVPGNYVSKTKARQAGWVNTEGNLWDVLPGKSIGGGGFHNDDGMMPDAPGREWRECDIGYEGGFRNAKRLVYSNDGLVYYTDDHYNTFQRLY